MNHEEAREAYSRSLGGTLEPQLQEQLKDHLAGCDDCRVFCKKFQQSVNALWELPGAPPVPSGLLARVAEKIAVTPQSVPSRWHWGIPVLAFASVICVVIGGYLVVYKRMPQGLPSMPIASPEPSPALSFRSSISYKLPEASINDIRAIEKLLLTVPLDLIRSGNSFRGAGSDKDSNLDKALKSAALSKLEPTAELKEILNDRHNRSPNLEALKTAGKIAEGPDGLLFPVPGASVSSDEKKLVQEENNDRKNLLRLCARQLSGKLGKAEDIITPELERQFAAVRARP